MGTIWAHGCGVNPSIETKYNWHTCHPTFFRVQSAFLAECRFLRAMHERAWRVRTLTDTNLAKDGGRFPEIRGSHRSEGNPRAARLAVKAAGLRWHVGMTSPADRPALSYGPNLARSSDATTGHVESGAGSIF